MQLPAPNHCVLLVQKGNVLFEGSTAVLFYPTNQMPVNHSETDTSSQFFMLESIQTLSNALSLQSVVYDMIKIAVMHKQKHIK